MIAAMHMKDAGGHYATHNTVTKILNAGFWWPTMYKDTHDYIQRCDSYQRTRRPISTTRWPLVPIMPLAPFEKWGINFVGPIQSATRHTQRQYILVATDYATKMVEAEATRKGDAATVSIFLFKLIITRYGCPLELVSDIGTHFLNAVIEDLTSHFQIKHRKTTPYNPKANGLTEKSNRLLCKILLKMMVSHAHDWNTKLPAALWAYRSAEKVTTKQTPYYLTYGQHPILPVEFELPTHRILDRRRLGDEKSQLYRLQEVLSLKELREAAKQRTKQIQWKRKKAYDKRVQPVTLLKGDFALVYDSRHARFLGKLHLRWMGPYKVVDVFPNGSV